MIDGVLIEERKIIGNEKGDVLHMLRCDAPFFKKFGEVYFSFVLPGAVKGWKKHRRQTQHFSVPVGELKLVLFDDRDGSATQGEVQEIRMDLSQHRLVRIPPGIWYGFTATGDDKALIVNCTDIPHDPSDTLAREPGDKTIPYSWQ